MDGIRRAGIFTLSAALLAGSGAALALESGQAADGAAYVIGGIGLDEVEALGQQRERFSLSVRTALRGSGDYLADVQLLVTDAQGRAVFHRPLDGPWLLIDLKPGRYDVQATWHGARQSRSVTIPPQGHREAIFYFDAAD